MLRHLTLSVALLFGTPSAFAVDRAVLNRLETIESEFGDADTRMRALDREYRQRRGLIGAVEAQQRYEDAVYAYLVGEYERAALGFFTLVEADALAVQGLAQDSQYYLAECLFELGNHKSALQAYDIIIGQDKGHPFFGRAVERELEIYGILQDNDAFYEVYQRYILSGRVPATDAVKYTVAKSFYRQGEAARAKSMFMEIPEGATHYGRARYFLGTVLASEGEIPSAIAEFKRVEDVGQAEGRELQQLCWLALGRLHYETAEYGVAQDYYQRITSDSLWFADQLYELTWTFIKQDKWEDALRQVEIFLLAYPEHRYSMQLQLTQGHLHMKRDQFENALATYDTLVSQYTPLHQRIASLEASRDDPAEFFKRIVEADALDSSRYALPAYAIEMLVDDPDMSRAVGARKELRRQDRDLAHSQEMVDEIRGVLASSDAIGTFSRGRGGLLRLADDGLRLRSDLVSLEIDYLVDNVSDSNRAEVKSLRDRWAVLQTRSEDVQGAETARTDRYQAYDDQVREIQGEAWRVQDIATQLRSEATAVRRALKEKRAQLTPEDLATVERLLAATEADLDRLVGDAGRIQSDATRRTVLANVAEGRTTEGANERGLIAADYHELRKLLSRYRGQVTDQDRNQVFGQLDQMWAKVVTLDATGSATLDHLEEAERAERAVVKRKLSEEAAQVVQLKREVDGTAAGSQDLAVRITRNGFGRLEGELSETIMQADMGIVDVYWLRKTEVSEEITRLAKERGVKLEELDSRFKIIRQKLED